MNIDELLTALGEMKAGWKTTEFWTGLVIILTWALTLVRPNVGWLTIVQSNQSTIALLAMSIVFAVYAAGRNALKIAHLFGLLKGLSLPGDDTGSAPTSDPAPVTFPVAPTGVGAGVVLTPDNTNATNTNWQVTNSTVANPATTTTATLSAS